MSYKYLLNKRSSQKKLMLVESSIGLLDSWDLIGSSLLIL